MCPAGDGTTYDCTTSDDGVCDTKPHKRPVTLDEITCGDQPACFNMGVAPVTNFMNYTTDACRNQFTPGQFTRVRQCTGQYRPAMVANASGTDIFLPASFAVRAGTTLRFTAGSTVHLPANGTATVPAGATLAFDAGATVRGGAGARLAVYGTLNATGAAFTSEPGGTWGGLYFASGSAGTLTDAVVENGQA